MTSTIVDSRSTAKPKILIISSMFIVVFFQKLCQHKTAVLCEIATNDVNDSRLLYERKNKI